LPSKTLLAVNVVAPVPPCATVNAVVKPVREVISEFAPLFAATKFVREVVALATSERLLALVRYVSPKTLVAAVIAVSV